MASKFYFFTDVDLLNNQSAYQHFGEITAPLDPDYSSTEDRFRVTSLHSSSSAAWAYAVCDSLVAIQQSNDDDDWVNVILKPLSTTKEKSDIRFPRIKYIILKGIDKLSIFDGNGDVDQTLTHDLNKKIKNSFIANGNAGDINVFSGITFDSAHASGKFTDTNSVDNIFTYHESEFNPIKLSAGDKIGKFILSDFGIEIILDTLGAEVSLGQARSAVNVLSAPKASISDSSKFISRNKKESVLDYVDPCAFFGSFYYDKLRACESNGGADVKKSAKDIYDDVLNTFTNRNKIYLDIRNELNYSLNYYLLDGFEDILLNTKNDAGSINIGSKPYYSTTGWPVFFLDNTHFAAATNQEEKNVIELSLPYSETLDNRVFYLAQGSFDEGGLGSNLPKQPKRQRRFRELEVDSINDDYLEAVSITVPHFMSGGNSSVISSYIRIKCVSPTPITDLSPLSNPFIRSRQHFMDYVYNVSRLKLPSVHQDNENYIRLAVYDDELYMDLLDRPAEGLDDVSSIGIASDPNNITLFSFSTCNRKYHSRAKRQHISFTGEVTKDNGSFLITYFSDRLKDFFGLKKLNTVRTEAYYINAQAKFLPCFKDVDHGSLLGNFFEMSTNEYTAIVIKRSNYAALFTLIESLKSTASISDQFDIWLTVGPEEEEKEDSNGKKYISTSLQINGYKVDSVTGDVTKVDYSANIILHCVFDENRKQNLYIDKDADMQPVSLSSVDCSQRFEWTEDREEELDEWGDDEERKELSDYTKVYRSDLLDFIEFIQPRGDFRSQLLWNQVGQYFVNGPAPNYTLRTVTVGGKTTLDPSSTSINEGIMMSFATNFALWLADRELHFIKKKSEVGTINVIDAILDNIDTNTELSKRMKDYLLTFAPKGEYFKTRFGSYAAGSKDNFFGIFDGRKSFNQIQDAVIDIWNDVGPSGSITDPDLIRITNDIYQIRNDYIDEMTQCIFRAMGGDMSCYQGVVLANGQGTGTTGILGDGSIAKSFFRYMFWNRVTNPINYIRAQRTFTYSFNNVRSRPGVRKILHICATGAENPTAVNITLKTDTGNGSTYTLRLISDTDRNRLIYGFFTPNRTMPSPVPSRIDWLRDSTSPPVVVAYFDQDTQNLEIYDENITSVDFEINPATTPPNEEDVCWMIYFFCESAPFTSSLSLSLDELYADDVYKVDVGTSALTKLGFTEHQKLQLRSFITFLKTRTMTNDVVCFNLQGKFVGRRRVPKPYSVTDLPYAAGRYVIHNNVLYKAASVISTPATPESGLPWKAATFVPNDTYNSDDLILHNSKVYRCKKKANCDPAYSPSSFIDQDWELVASVFNTSDVYPKDSVVLYDNDLYFALEQHTGAFNPTRWLLASKVERDTLYEYSETLPNNFCKQETDTQDTVDYPSRRYSFLSLVIENGVANINIESFASPLRSRLEQNTVSSFDKDEIDAHTFVGVYGLYNVSTNPTGSKLGWNLVPVLPSYNQLLTSLRCLGVMEAFALAIKEQAKADNNNADDVVLNNIVDALMARPDLQVRTIPDGSNQKYVGMSEFNDWLDNVD